MAHGITLWMLGFSRSIAERELPEWQPKERDRSLPGRARIRARKAARR